METWRQLQGFDYDYEVSDQGSVRSWINRLGKRQATPHLLKSTLNADGYACCQMRMNRANKRVRVHRLVLAAFVGESDLQVNHRNGDKCDNRLENLEYVTAKENTRHAKDVLGRPGGAKGEMHGMAKLTDTQVADAKRLASEGLSQRKIAQLFGVSQSSISAWARGALRGGE